MYPGTVALLYEYCTDTQKLATAVYTGAVLLCCAVPVPDTKYNQTDTKFKYLTVLFDASL